MIARLGTFATAVGIAGALLVTLQAGRAAFRPGRVSRAALQLPVMLLVLGAVGAFASLEAGLLTDDFSLEYVAKNHSRATPLLYTITGAWSALAGSIALWVLVLALYTAVLYRSVRSGDRLGLGALAVSGVVATFFFVTMAVAANPFRTLDVPPTDGPGPNPLLQNHIMVAFHPPLLYAGLIGFTVPFAYAISALLLGSGGSEWLVRTRRWTLVSWCCLTAGVVVGGWWSYEVLGWGGYWAWDPVENASFLPWLVGTAFLHSAVVQLRRGLLQLWTFVLVIVTFALTILATFLTRSGVVASVHSFSPSRIGPALLGFFLLVSLGGLLLVGLRARLVGTDRTLDSLASREGMFLVNNLLLTLFAFVVLLGTTYPLLAEAVTGRQLSVGRPYFDRLAVPLMLALLAAMLVGPLMPWRRAGAGLLWQRLRWPLLVALLAGAAAVLSGLRSVETVLTLILGTAILAAAIRQLWTAAGNVGGPRWSAPLRAMSRDRGYWGGQISHVGLAIVAVAIAVSGTLTKSSEVEITAGRPAVAAGYQVSLDGLRTFRGPNREVLAVRVTLAKSGRVVRVAEPRVNQFDGLAQAVGTPSVWTRATKDVYVTVNRADPTSGVVRLSVFVFPYRTWLWVGGFVTVVGGLLGFSTRRRERPAAVAAPSATGEEVLLRG